MRRRDRRVGEHLVRRCESVPARLEPREERVPLRRPHLVRVQQENLRDRPAEQLLAHLRLRRHLVAQRRLVLLGDPLHPFGVSRAPRLNPALLVRPVLIVDGDGHRHLTRVAEVLAHRVELRHGVTLRQVREPEEPHRAAVPLEQACKSGAPCLHVRDVCLGTDVGVVGVALRVVAELVASREPPLKQRNVGGAGDVPPYHERHGRHVVPGENGEQVLRDPLPLRRIVVQVAHRYRQVVHGNEKGPRRCGALCRSRHGRCHDPDREHPAQPHHRDLPTAGFAPARRER